jgi:DinB superfamily
MATPTYSLVCHELHAARGHLYAIVESLSQDELLWLPPRPDGIAISYHFGHIALVEDHTLAEETGQVLLATLEWQHTFGVRNVNNRTAVFPSGAEIIDYIQRVRARTVEVLAQRFRKILSPNEAVTAAEVFRRVINHEYSHTKYIRRIRSEMNKSAVEAPASELIQADENAVAAPQYILEHW